MKYKVGDKVRIKSLDWYNENKNKKGFIYFDYANFTPVMSQYCGEILTIKRVMEEFERYHVSECAFSWTDEMIEGLVEEEEIEFTEEDKYWCDIMSESDPTTYVLPQGYQFKDENGNVINAQKIVLEKKKKEYPKTFEECCKILGILNVDLCFNADYRSFDASKEQWKRLGLMNQFYQLLICRDAYWKIAGEEMGLEKPWEPDWNDDTTHKFIIHTITDKIHCGVLLVKNHLLAFPTPEMRDAFKKNFDPDIEICKELL